MAKKQKSTAPPSPGFWIIMACCALGAITFIALFGGEIEGERVGPNIEHKSN